jgi:hypothetical protein
LALGILIVVFSLFGCNKEPTPNSKKIITEKIGTDASIAAAPYLSAWRECEVIGVNDVQDWAEVKGSLNGLAS